jgi:hypothetical protein
MDINFCRHTNPVSNVLPFSWMSKTPRGIKTVMSLLHVLNLLHVLVNKKVVFHGHGHTCEIKNMRHRRDNLYADGCFAMLVAETRQNTFDSHVPLTNNMLLRV